MHSLAFFLLFTQLSTQLPWSQGSSPGLVSHEHSFSPYGSKLKRVAAPKSTFLGRRQWTDWNGWHGPQPPVSEGSASIIDNEQVKYLIPVTIGSQTLDLEIDTGSSDTWAIQTGFTCYETFNATTFEFVHKEPHAHCNFGPSFTPGESFQPSTERFLHTCYGQSEAIYRCVQGELGTVPVNVFGLQIQQQLVGAPINSSQVSEGKNISSGLIGLAYPAGTGGYSTSTLKPAHYSSIMNTLFNIDTFNPPLPSKFSLALSRDVSQNGNGGIFTVGGIPSLSDPSVNVSSSTSASAPLEYVASVSNTSFSLYQIKADNFVIGPDQVAVDTSIIIDSGAPNFQLPGKHADAINALWSPPGKGPITNLTLDCKAVLTEPVGVTIGGSTFYLQAQDLLLRNTDGTCASYVSACVAGQCLVGDPFLKNVLAVFDWEGSQLSFYPREYYAS